MKKQTKAFTLVELIVVIVILAILWAIAFISFQGYSRNSRDWVRIADINSAKKSLEIFITKAWFYPTPDNGTNITYSWAIVWTEGTLWSNVTKNIQSLNKVITDPLTSTEYTYSITSSKTEYQIWWISEWWWLTGNIPTDSTYAADLSKTSAVAYIGWNYNEKFTKVNSWTISWILAEPSIISTDKTTSTDLANILANKKLAYNNYPNIPSSFSTPWTETGWFNYSNPNPIIYSWTLEDLHDDNTKKLAFITNLKQAYASTDLAINPMYEDIMSQDTTNDSTWTINLAITYINSNKWWIKLQELALLPTSWTWTTWWWTITYTCATQPTYTHATFTTWTPTQTNQTWQNTNSWNPCYYSCTDWYTWSDCSIEPTTWQDEDSNCTISTDVTTSWTDLSWNPITQVWAPCNSTLWTGIIYNATNICWNYQWTNIGWTSCYWANNLESSYNSTYWVNNIWWKLYLWSNSSSACPNWRHLPDNEDFTILLKNLWCSNYWTATSTWRLCDWLWWSWHTLRTNTNNIENLLKIPLAGFNDNTSFFTRWYNTHLWSSSQYDSSNALSLDLSRDVSTVGRTNFSKTYGFSVRCIKD